MQNRFVAVLLLCCASVIQANPATTEQGKQLFEQSGCSVCHTSSVQDGNAAKGVAHELPFQSRLLTKLKALALIILDREGRTDFVSNQACSPWYAAFSTEYARVEQLILRGNPIAPMPSWKQRVVQENTNDQQDDIGSIDAIIDYLLISEGVVLSRETIAGWNKRRSDCSVEQTLVRNKNYSGRRQEIVNRLEYLDKKKRAFEKIPSANFLSYQTHLFNQVSFLQDGNLDIWLLRQAEGSDINFWTINFVKEGRFPNPLLFVIVVDRRYPEYRLYFFKKPHMQFNYALKNTKRFFIPEMANNPNYFVDADLGDCLSCHASGLLRIRPRHWAGIESLSADDWVKVKAWNQRMLSYGSATVDWPAAQPPLSAYAVEQVPLASCRECHSAGNIRSSLMRFQAKSIIALMNAHEKRDAYFDYSRAEPDVIQMLLANDFRTTQLSVSPVLLPVMPPLSPLTATENEQLIRWLGEQKN